MEEDSSSNPTVENEEEYPVGTESEILRIRGAELALVAGCCRAAKILRTGDFAVRVARLSGSPLGVSFCSVEDHHWPVARDGQVVRVGSHRFGFALPGYQYGLRLPVTCSEHELRKLEKILVALSGYSDHYGQTNEFNFHEKSEAVFWTLAAAMIEKINDPTLPLSRTGDPRGRLSRPSSMDHTELRAIKFSAVTKLVTQTVLRGAITSGLHMQIVGPLGGGGRGGAQPKVFPSMRTFADVTAALETSGGGIDGRTAVGAGRERCWVINRLGLMLLVRIVWAASMTNRTEKPARSVKEEVEK